jgi:type IV secretion system protein VirB6
MAAACPIPGPEDPVVPSLLAVVDCNVQGLVRAGYGSLFASSGPFSVLLTSLLTIFVAVIGYRLLLGRSQLRITDFALTVVKLGVVLALATRWEAYQTLVYDFLFDGPAQLAGTMLSAVQPEGSVFRGDVFTGLQRALDALNVFATGYSRQVPTTTSPLLGGPSFGAMALTLSSGVLLLSSLGVLLAAKIVLGLLLAVGPVFIMMLLFDSTRGLFEGWLRACLAFAFAPLASTLLLGVALTMLEPPLVQMAELRTQNAYPLGPVYSVLTLVLVFAGVSLGFLVAGGMIASGLRLPRGRGEAAGADVQASAAASEPAVVSQPRAVRIAAAAAAMERRDTVLLGGGGRNAALLQGGGGGLDAGGYDRRTNIAAASTVERGREGRAPETRLGQAPRRTARPRPHRAGARSTR